MSELEKIAKKLENGGYGVKIEGERMKVWESWEPECVRILGAKSYKEALNKRNNGIEANYNLVCLSSKISGKDTKISESVFRLIKPHQVIKAGDYVRLVSSTNPYVPSGSIMKVESLAQVTDKNNECQIFNCSYKGHPYTAHRRVIELANYIEPEKVSFT
jgi:hypothetical protein